jgi:hypothetical protein
MLPVAVEQPHCGVLLRVQTSFRRLVLTSSPTDN